MVQFGNLTDTERQGLIYLTAHDTFSVHGYLGWGKFYNLNRTSQSTIGETGRDPNSPTFGQLSGYGLYASSVFIEGSIADTNGVLFSHHFAVTDSMFSVFYDRPG